MGADDISAAIGSILICILIFIRVRYLPPTFLWDLIFAGWLWQAVSMLPIPIEGAVSFLVFCVVGTRFWARHRRKVKEKKQAEEAEKAAPIPEPKMKPVTPPPAQPAPPKPQVRQTLNTCLRCSHALEGPVCSGCGYDHRKEPVHLLGFVHPQDLRIKVE